MPRRSARDQPVELTLAQVMLPSDANPQGNVHGGALMKLVDTAGAMCASRFIRHQVVTVVMDSMTFVKPVYVGNLVFIRAQITWTGRTSIETEVAIDAEDVLTGQVNRVSDAYVVYVGIDETRQPTPIRPFEPQTNHERRRWRAAERRRAQRLESHR